MAGQVYACHSPCAWWLLGAEEDAQREAPGHLLHWSLLGGPLSSALVMSPSSGIKAEEGKGKAGGIVKCHSAAVFWDLSSLSSRRNISFRLTRHSTWNARKAAN